MMGEETLDAGRTGLSEASAVCDKKRDLILSQMDVLTGADEAERWGIEEDFSSSSS